MTKYSEPNFPAIFNDNEEGIRQFDKELIKSLVLWSNVLQAILDAGISFDDNMDVAFVSYTSHGTPGTETAVAHDLGKVPDGYIVAGQTAAGSAYDGTTTNTKTTIYLKSDVAAVTFRLIIF